MRLEWTQKFATCSDPWLHVVQFGSARGVWAFLIRFSSGIACWHMTPERVCNQIFIWTVTCLAKAFLLAEVSLMRAVSRVITEYASSNVRNATLSFNQSLNLDDLSLSLKGERYMRKIWVLYFQRDIDLSFVWGWPWSVQHGKVVILELFQRKASNLKP